MQTVDLEQGTPEWLAHRKNYFNASDAPVMLGLSPYKSRSTLLQERRTGVSADVPLAVQARFNEGHRVEALARAWVETTILGEDLSPLVGIEGNLSASFDGITFCGDVVFEHKLLNDTIRKALPQRGENSLDNLPEHYKVQMEQQLLVSGAEKCLFVASAWTPEPENRRIDERYGWYFPDKKRRQTIVRGWMQFQQDLGGESKEEPVYPIKVASQDAANLPVPRIALSGNLSTKSNLEDVEVQLDSYIESLPTQPESEDDFQECATAAKKLKEAEDALRQILEDGLMSVTGYAEVREKIDAMCAKARETRLICEKAWDAENRSRKNKLVEEAQSKWDTYIKKMTAKVKRDGFTLIVEAPNFAEAIKGQRSPESIDNKLSAALIDAQATADIVVQKVLSNFKLLDKYKDFWFLFMDSNRLVYQESEALQQEITDRIATYTKKEGMPGVAAQVDVQRDTDSHKAPARSRRKTQSVVDSNEVLIGLKYFKTMLLPIFLNKKDILKISKIPFDIMSNRDAKWTLSSTVKILDAIIAHVQSIKSKLLTDPEWVKTIAPYPTQKEQKAERDRLKAAKKKAEDEGGHNEDE
ncbi:MAG: YqaJ viral recombinase family protein [Actinomycetaceae bacterium]|nr:YqaJ viral recombinase family protein [Actinomycetaceae bacterium]